MQQNSTAVCQCTRVRAMRRQRQVPGEVPNGMLLDDVPEADAAGGYSDDEDEGGLIVDDLLNNARQVRPMMRMAAAGLSVCWFAQRRQNTGQCADAVCAPERAGARRAAGGK